MMAVNISEIKNKGMQCLVEHMGVVEAELFISIILREQFDYTKWQREYYDAMKPGEFMKHAAAYARLHPFEGQARRVRIEQGEP